MTMTKKHFLKRHIIGAVLALSPGVTLAQTTLWGMTTAGGTSGQGVIYSVATDGSGLTVGHSFASDGVDGNAPSNGLTEGSDGHLYGMTSAGGLSGLGTLFSIDPVSGNYQKQVDFTGANGASPQGALLLHGGILYGLTPSGGAYGYGNLFSYDPASGTLTDLLDLDGTKGSYPGGNLTAIGNQLFFATGSGGANGAGSLDVYDLGTNTCSDLYDFSNGSYVFADLLWYDQVLYGVSYSGGSRGMGNIFSYDPIMGKYTDLYDFSGPSSSSENGQNPGEWTLVGNKFYGVAGGGAYINGNAPEGVLFCFDPAAQTCTDLYDFNAGTTLTTGLSPQAPPLAVNGQLYMTSVEGGSVGDGVAFVYNLTSGATSKIGDFNGPNGNFPNGGRLVQVVRTGTGTTPQTLSFTNIAKTYGDPNFVLQATSTSGLPITYTSSDYTVGALIADGIHPAGAGTCTITATQPGDTTYAPATPVSVTLTVAQAALLVKADDQFKYQNQPNPPLTITYSGFVNGDDSSILNPLPQVATGVTLNALQGTYPITISGPTTPNYAITYQPGVFTVLGLQQFLTVTDSVATYGDPDFAMATASTGLTVTYHASDPSIASDGGDGKIHIVGAGTTKVAVIQVGNATYAEAVDTVLLTVHQVPLTIAANNQSIVSGQPDPLFTVTYSGFVLGEGAAALTTLPTVVSTAEENPPYPGSYLIEPSGAVSQNYSITYVNGLLTVSLPGDSLNAFCSDPATLAVNVLSTGGGSATILVYSMSGQTVAAAGVTLQTGFNHFSFPVAQLAAGIYVVLVKGAAINLNQRVKIK